MSTTDPATAYARDVVDGLIPAGRYHRLSCQRHLTDLDRQGASDFPYVFDWSQAERFLRFARKIRHYKGEGEAGQRWAGQLFEPSPNQVFRFGCIFGWRRADGLRRFTTAYQEMPRKSGKTFEVAIIALYVTFFEGEPGAEGVCAATKRSQARRVFDDMAKFVQSSGLKSRLTVQAHNIHSEATSSKFEPLGADADSTDGLNLQCIVTDEYHAHKTNDLVDVLESSTGSRRNPLHSIITTAGDDPVSPCGKQHDYICQILEGVIRDEATDATFGFIASADPGDDWQAEATWIKANPQWGISVLPTDMRKRALEAKSVPSKAAEFRQKRLNEWVNASNPCLSLDGWRLGQSDWAEDDMKGQPCYVGVDLASKIDLCALSYLFPPTVTRKTWRLIQRVWMPSDTLTDRAHRDRAPYPVWASQNWVILTPGASIDHDLVRRELLAGRERFTILQIGFDPWHAETPITNLVKQDGFAATQVLEVSQTYQGMSAACLRLQAEIIEGHVDARGCPVTAWAVSNTVDQRDGKDNMMFVKKKSRGRIDPVISATIAMSLVIRQTAAAAPKYQMLVFNSRG